MMLCGKCICMCTTDDMHTRTDQKSTQPSAYTDYGLLFLPISKYCYFIRHTGLI